MNFILDTFTKKLPVNIFTLHALKVTFYNQEVMDTYDHNSEQELLPPRDKRMSGPFCTCSGLCKGQTKPERNIQAAEQLPEQHKIVARTLLRHL